MPPFYVLLAVNLATWISFASGGRLVDDGFQEGGSGNFTLRAASWPLYSINADKCGTCAGVSVEELKTDRDFGVGCISKDAQLPACPLLNSDNSNQAGGHAGTILRLSKGLLAKATKAFDNEEESKLVHIQAASLEYQAYMETWCLRRLSKKEGLSAEVNAMLSTHVLRRFALGENPFAAEFYGSCRKACSGEDGQPQECEKPMIYLVMDNQLAPYQKPCQIDLKLGSYTVEPGLAKSLKLSDIRKSLIHAAGDHISPTASQGVRLAGFKVHNPYTMTSEKMASKMLSPLGGLEAVFDTFFDPSGHDGDVETMEALKDRTFEMATWWGKHGRDTLKAVALSALMTYECKPEVAASITMSDIKVSGESSVGVDSAYVALSSKPRRLVYATSAENVPEIIGDEDSDYADLRGGYRSPDASNSSWLGKQFEVDLGSQLQYIVLSVWDGSGKDCVGQVEVPLSDLLDDSRKCWKMSSWTALENKVVDAELCADVTSQLREHAPRAKPQMKLIDYAHFWPSEDVDWPQDGVNEGLVSIIKHFDLKEIRDQGVVAEGSRYKNLKCQSQDSEIKLTKASCKRYGRAMGQKFITW
eukprot:TRINITY_DN948_c0_g1_i1.p1 TRINITY_DN948_c0_g1~~TRINITY_DN948_c0_g1_i1.p1  ORF type:complete len:587 (-),score=106.20 TRINITY_DN948_c0_g1_i1:454-2214(-)